MNLDIFTVSITSFFLYVMMIIILLGLKLSSKVYTGFNNWIYSLSLMLVSYLFFGLRGNISEIYTVIFANVILLFSIYFMLKALEMFYLEKEPETKTGFKINLILILGLTAGFIYCYYFHADARVRTILINLGIGIMAFRGMLIPRKYLTDKLGVSDRMVMTGLLMMAMISWLRVIYVFSLTSMSSPMEQDPSMRWMLFFGAISVNLTVFAVISLINERNEKELNRANNMLRTLADHDSLTGAVTRRRFDQVADFAVKNSRRQGQPLTLIIFDLDYFKKINDKFGHLTGDKVLKLVVSQVRQTLREVDTIARMGGEEFLILLPQSTIESSKIIVERIVQKIKEIPVLTGLPGELTISGGVAAVREADANIYDTIKRADDLLYKAKRDGRNRFYFTD